MASIIDTLKDKVGNLVYPKTYTKAVYDIDTEDRLDNVIADIQAKTIVGTSPITSTTVGTTTTITHNTSGVSAGTYKSVTVDTKGHVTGGTNPTTLAGYGITDAAPSSHVGATGSAHGLATGSANGFMSSTQYTALSNLNTREFVNKKVSSLSQTYTQSYTVAKTGYLIARFSAFGATISGTNPWGTLNITVGSYITNTIIATGNFYSGGCATLVCPITAGQTVVFSCGGSFSLTDGGGTEHSYLIV